MNQHKSKSRKGKVFALNSILQEHTLRYITLKEFYENLGQDRDVRYETEVKAEHGSDPIDLVLYEGPNRFVFEIKRWQNNSDKNRIIRKDIEKLGCFQNKDKDTYCYELIFTDNDFEKTKEIYEKEFNEEFRETQLKLLRCKTIGNVDFTVCIYLAELK